MLLDSWPLFETIPVVADDAYGLVTFPVPAPDVGAPVSDPALAVLLGFAKAVLNAQLGAAWAAVAPGTNPVNGTFAHDPERVGFPANDRAWPALYAYRKGGQAPYDLATDFRVAPDTVVLLWINVSTQQDRQALRAPAVNGAAKALDRAIRRGRAVEYVAPGDVDPLAATLAVVPDAVKLAVASSTSPTVYSDSALDGSVGSSAISPRRPVVVSFSGDPAAFATGSSVLVTGTNALGLIISDTLVVRADRAALTTSQDYATVTSIAVGAQASAAGTLTVGLGAFAGLGSFLTDALNALEDITPLRPATARPIVIRMVDGSPPMTYPGVEWQFTLTEQLQLADGEYDSLDGIDLAITREDGSVFESASL